MFFSGMGESVRIEKSDIFLAGPGCGVRFAELDVFFGGGGGVRIEKSDVFLAGPVCGVRLQSWMGFFWVGGWAGALAKTNIIK